MTKQWRAYVRQRNQAIFRKEGWDFDFESEWLPMWDGKQRGRKSTDYCMKRTNVDLPWTAKNTEVVLRKIQVSEQHVRRTRYIFNTPRGEFHNLTAAAKAHDITYFAMLKLCKTNPTEYFYPNHNGNGA